MRHRAVAAQHLSDGILRVPRPATPPCDGNPAHGRPTEDVRRTTDLLGADLLAAISVVADPGQLPQSFCISSAS